MWTYIEMAVGHSITSGWLGQKWAVVGAYFTRKQLNIYMGVEVYNARQCLKCDEGCTRNMNNRRS
jgi:hypothetical protein